MNEQEIYLLIIRFLSDRTQSNENEVLADWLAASKENEATFERIESIWEARKNDPYSQDSELVLQNLQHKLKMTSDLPDIRRKKRMPVLAGFVLLLLVPATLLFYTHLKSGAAAFKEVKTKLGERISLKLSDGTKITLGPDSKLRYPAVFSDTLRRVDLTGEAFFDVSKNPHRPFIVHSGIGNTRVLGTKFDVCAYPDDSKMAVALVEGKVEVRNGDKIYHVSPGQELLLNKSDHHIYLQNFDKIVVTGWMNNKLAFRDIPFFEAAGRLERLYNVNIIFYNKGVAERTIWATFDNEPITQILETIKSATGIKYKIKGRTIYIKE